MVLAACLLIVSHLRFGPSSGPRWRSVRRAFLFPVALLTMAMFLVDATDRSDLLGQVAVVVLLGVIGAQLVASGLWIRDAAGARLSTAVVLGLLLWLSFLLLMPAFGLVTGFGRQWS
jgi:hypothetical protein